jgi:Ser/Thr protein kinase RdoA (MazF antagonist)
MSGGVSSDIWRVDGPSGTFCVKRALARLKVAADGARRSERNRNEVAWFRTAAGHRARAVPAILGDDPAGGAFAMSYLAPDRHPVWKRCCATAVTSVDRPAVGDVLGRIHQATADRPDVASTFATDAVFHAIRLEPTSRRRSRASGPGRPVRGLVATTASTRRVLVHGDFSPKNLLVGRRARWSSTPNARGSAIRRSTSRSC